jgi:DNA invertase Pin-like site-specific DNA recombinase
VRAFSLLNSLKGTEVYWRVVNRELEGNMRAALYGRVSTDSKNKAKRQETENQMQQLRAFAESQGWIVGREYVDRVTGGTADCEQFQQMFQDASQRQFDVLLF